MKAVECFGMLVPLSSANSVLYQANHPPWISGADRNLTYAQPIWCSPAGMYDLVFAVPAAPIPLFYLTEIYRFCCSKAVLIGLRV